MYISVTVIYVHAQYTIYIWTKIWQAFLPLQKDKLQLKNYHLTMFRWNICGELKFEGMCWRKSRHGSRFWCNTPAAWSCWICTSRDVYNVYDLYIVDACNIVWKGSFLETRPTRWRKVEGLTVPLIMTRFARQVDSSRRKRQRLLRLTTRALAQRKSAQRIQVCQQY